MSLVSERAEKVISKAKTLVLEEKKKEYETCVVPGMNALPCLKKERYRGSRYRNGETRPFMEGCNPSRKVCSQPRSGLNSSEISKVAAPKGWARF